MRSQYPQLLLRHLIPGISGVLAALLLLPWATLTRLALTSDQYSHILLVPIITIGLVSSDRKRILANVTYCLPAALPAAAVCSLIISLQTTKSAASVYRLPLVTLCGVVLVCTIFLLCFGRSAFRRALFPLLFLFLMIPIPAPAMSQLTRVLQEGSADFSAILFHLIQLPALRENLKFSLPGFDIEVAEQCSGIRSSLALCIVSILAGHLCLRSWWRKLVILAITLPLVVFKNALRIVVISALGLYVNREFLHGAFHRYSGLPFSLLEIMILAPIMFRWYRIERRAYRDLSMENERFCDDARKLGDRLPPA